MLQVTFETNQEFTDTIKAGRDECSRLTRPPLVFGQHKNKSSLLESWAKFDDMICIYAVYVDWSSLKESVLVVTLSTVSRCAWHLAGTAEAAAGKLNMLPTNWASERLSSVDTFLFILVFSRIKMCLSLKKKKERKKKDYFGIYPKAGPFDSRSTLFCSE